MADARQLEILKSGVKAWNKWREENPAIEIDLTEADLDKANLVGANLQKASLRNARLVAARFNSAKLYGASLVGADLESAWLEHVDLEQSDLSNSHLFFVDFRRTNLRNACLRGANLMGASFYSANLNNCKFGEAMIGQTVFGNTDLSKAHELDKVIHDSPSIVDTKTLQLSAGKISEKFLKGCGLSDVDIEYSKLANPELSNQEINAFLYKIYDLRATQAIQINPLFISYSHKDSTFVDEMEKRLNEKGIRFWRDIHNATAGRLEKVVDRAMRQNPTVLLVLSENSVQSDWVEHEARSARELEKELKRDVLCPVALDDSWKSCSWPARLREQIMEYNILDFSNWKDESEFARKFTKLVEGLDLFYKG